MSTKTDEGTTSGEDTHGAGVRIPPPVILLGFILAGAGLNKIWPQASADIPAIRWVGYTAIGVTLAVFAFSVREFFRAGTDIRPDKPSTAMIRKGPYRWSRNPIYLCMVLLQAGIGLAVGNPWIVILALPFFMILSRYVIAREERYLERLFGDDYLAYKIRVRRWL